MLPNFLVVGAQKSGTTSLHEYLRAHSEVYLPEQKETKFFLRDEIFSRGIGYYEEHFFGDWKGEAAVGEVDPDYMYFFQCLDRMRANLDLANIKLIFVFRNPVDRAFSHYLMTYRRGLEELSFEDALAAESARIALDDVNRMHYSYADRGFYARQLERFTPFVDRSNMLFLLSEDLAEDPVSEIRKCYDFLGLDPSIEPDSTVEKFHQAAVPRSAGLLRLIKRDGWHKELIRLILPNERFRLGLRARILALNEKPGSDLKVPDDLRERLLRGYRKDMDSLQQMTGLDLGKWFNIS